MRHHTFLFLFFIATICLGHFLPAAWFEEIKIKKQALQTKWDEKTREIFVYVDLRGTKPYFTTLFTKVDKKISAVHELAGSTLLFATNQNYFIYKYKPARNGVYHFACAYLKGATPQNQEYIFINDINTVEVKGLAAPAEKQPETNAPPAASNTAPQPAAAEQPSDQHPAVTEPLQKADLDQIGKLIEKMRELNLEMRTRYFLRDYYDTLAIYQFFVRYAEISAQVDSLYLKTLLNRANWSYIEKINKEYRILTATFNDISKKIYQYLLDEKKRKEMQ